MTTTCIVLSETSGSQHNQFSKMQLENATATNVTRIKNTKMQKNEVGAAA